LYRVIAWGLVIGPIIWVAWTCARGPTVPQNDYWVYFNNIVGEQGFSRSPSEWLARHNNHLLTGAYAVYAVNLILTNGSNHGLALFSWVCGLGMLVLLGIWIRRTVGHSEILVMGLLIVSSWFVFSPLLAMFWFMGFSGVHTLGSVVLCLLAIHLWEKYQRSGRPVPLMFCLATTAVALTFFSSSLPALFVLAVAAVLHLRHDPRYLIPFLLLLATAFGLWLAGYEQSPSSSPTAAGLGSLVLFPFAFVGGALTRSIEPAIGVGLLAAALSVVLAVDRIRHSGDERSGVDTYWWMVLGFAGGNALLTALARSTMGLETAFASRYSVFPVLAWIALGVLLVDAVRRTRLRRVTVLVLFVVAVTSQVNGRSYFVALERRAQLEPAFREAVRMDVNDLEAVKGVVTPWAGALVKAMPALRDHGWVPFDDSASRASRIDPPPRVRPRPPETAIWAQRSLDASVQRVAGRLDGSLPLGTDLLLATRKGSVVGTAAVVPGLRPDGGRQSRYWIGYLRLSVPERVFVSAPSGKLVGYFRCCDLSRPLAGDVNPFASPYATWYRAGAYRWQWMQKILK
jgi:hypothetical protein